MLNRYFSVLAAGIFLSSISLQAVEAVIETDAPSKAESIKKKTVKKDAAASVSIDALVAKYQEASDEEAYKIMNQIKLHIAQMSQKRQLNAIGKVRQTADKKRREKRKVDTKQKKKKKKTVSKKQKRQLRQHKKRAQKRYKKQKNRALETISQTSYSAKHPDPMSVMNGISDSSGAGSHTGTSPGGGMGGFGGGGSGMGGMGGF